MQANIEMVHGYRILWIDDAESSKTALADPACDGYGANPHREKRGTAIGLKQAPANVRALALPYADRAGIDGAMLSRYGPLELLWICESSLAWSASMPALRVLIIGNAPKIKITDLQELTNLSLHPASAWGPISTWPDMRKLMELGLTQGAVKDLSGIQKFKSLRKLELGYMRSLKTISGVEDLSQLEDLTLDRCAKVGDLSDLLGRMRSLKSLRLLSCGSLPNLSFLKHLELSEFRFPGTTVVDGDLSSTDAIPMVAYDNKKHYNRKARSPVGSTP